MAFHAGDNLSRLHIPNRDLSSGAACGEGLAIWSEDGFAYPMLMSTESADRLEIKLLCQASVRQEKQNAEQA